MALIESLLSGTAVSILDQAVKSGKYAVADIRGTYKKVEHEQRVLAASKNYLNNYQKRHCQIKIMPGLMTEPRDLGSIYTAVKLLDDSSRRAFLGPDALEAAYREKGTRGFGSGDAQRVEGIDVANDTQFLMVLGGPGIGKSTFLRKIGLEALKRDGALKRECIPVFLELKKFREPVLDIKQKIIEEFATCQFPAAEALVESALDQGKLLVLFDGLDEVPSENLDQVIEKIEDFIDKYTQNVEDYQPQNSFVASCRTAAYRRSFLRFTDVTIAEFNDLQIEEFIRRWFSSPEDEALETAKEYIELLNQQDHRATKELAQTPLLLTFLCLVYDREQTLPSKRSTLYGRVLNIILNEWSAQKRIKRSPIYKGFHPDLEKVMLATIAYESFNKDQLFFSKDTIKDHITAFLADTLGAPESLNAEDVLDAIEIQQGILVERATDAYSFSHLTLQEYLTALHIVENRLEGELINQHLTDNRWREIFLLVAGLMKSPVSQLFSEMEKQSLCSRYVEGSQRLQQLISWASINRIGDTKLSQRAAMIEIAIILARVRVVTSATTTAQDNSTSCAIARNSIIAISQFFSQTIVRKSIDDASNIVVDNIIKIAKDIDIEIASFIDSDPTKAILSCIELAIYQDSAIEKARSIVANSTTDGTHHLFRAETFKLISSQLLKHQTELPKQNATSEQWSDWIEKLWLFILDALDLELGLVMRWIIWSPALRDYLYIIELLLKCKQSALFVSRNQWESLEKRLLTLEGY